MKIAMKAILLSLFVVAIFSQAITIDNSSAYYTQQGQTYQYIYGTGIQDPSTLGDRNSSAVKSGDNSQATYVSPPTGPTPVQITCPHNQVYDNILCQCVCIIGFYFEGSECVPYTNIIPTCNKNEIYKDGRCVCEQGFFLIGNKCDICPPYSTYDLPTLSCPCVYGYALLNGICALIYNPPTPPPKKIIPSCSINQKLINDNCVCLDNFYLIKGICTYCAAPNYYDAQLAICRPYCKINEVFDINSLICICNSGFFNINGECSVCIPFSTYNIYQKRCDCIQGYTLNNGNCIPSTRPPVISNPPSIPANNCKDNQVLVN